MNTYLKQFIVVASVLLFTGSFSFSDVGGVKADLTATKAHPNANGTAHFKDGKIDIQTKGLKPDSVYTVWFVNMKPKKHETGAGQPPYMFKTDSNGNGTYASALNESPVGKWEMIMIVLHPDGNPADMKNMIGALKAKL
ncbi:MAG TPA: hypothetical protein HPQ03_13315 [Deltaproteobacteria bacterium]|nr:hypothetical protein [Deltaproteobacteria bacterium]